MNATRTERLATLTPEGRASFEAIEARGLAAIDYLASNPSASPFFNARVYGIRTDEAGDHERALEALAVTENPNLPPFWAQYLSESRAGDKYPIRLSKYMNALQSRALRR